MTRYPNNRTGNQSSLDTHCGLRCLLAGCLFALSTATAFALDDNGDAPASYGIATHTIVPGAPYLGDNPPDADSGNVSDAADADDNDNPLNDEDGVFGFPKLVQNTKSYTVNVFSSNPGNNAVTLVGWVDFNGNGVFESFESSVTVLSAGSKNQKMKLLWNNLKGISTDFAGPTYARFRISSALISTDLAAGYLPDGEVEDYPLTIQLDSDGDEIADTDDLDNDNDSIPDSIEGVTADLDSDGVPNHLDPDSDGDGIPDLIEAGGDGSAPLDTDQDGSPDFLDLDSNNDGSPDALVVTGDVDGDGLNGDIEGIVDTDKDGVLNPNDYDSDNDTIPDSVETAIDSDGDFVPDFLDLDSDNDGLSDLFESGIDTMQVPLLDVDGDGRVDFPENSTGVNGLTDVIETQNESGVINYVIADTDQDGIRDAIDTDSDNDGVSDLLESGGADINNDGKHDDLLDSDSDGVPDIADANLLGEEDADGDSIVDYADADFVLDIDDSDNDGIIDPYDPDSDGDGIVDSVIAVGNANGNPIDANQNGIADYLDDQVSVPNASGNISETDLSGVIQDDGIIETGPGCSVRSTTGFSASVDPSFLIMLLMATLWFSVRAIQRRRDALQRTVPVMAKYTR